MMIVDNVGPAETSVVPGPSGDAALFKALCTAATILAWLAVAG